MSESWLSPLSIRATIEEMPEGCIAVVDATGIVDSGMVGDILCTRMKKHGVAALVTDGVVCDVAGARGTGMLRPTMAVLSPVRSTENERFATRETVDSISGKTKDGNAVASARFD